MPSFFRPSDIPILNKISFPSLTKAQAKAPSHPAGQELLELSKLAPAELISRLDSNGDGLDVEKAAEILAAKGPNEVAHEKKLKWYLLLWESFRTPFSLLLVVLSIVSYVTGDNAGGTTIAVMVFISTFLSFFQEYRSNQAAESLKAMVTTNATVIRRGEGGQAERKEVPLKEIVPGDVVFLSAGDMIPADLRLLTCKDIFVSQAALTGEALPVEKSADANAECPGALEAANLCFMGTNILSGTGTGIVLKTGGDTYFGCLASTITGRRVLTSFETGVNRFTRMMMIFMAVMVPTVLVINGVFKHNWYEAFMFAVAVAVGLTPEMLPMIVTVNLAKGALAMSKKKVIVKRLNSIQNFGAMDVLCTDKTGTLTQNKVALLKFVDVSGFKSQKILNYGFLNSYYQTGLKNLLDVAVLESSGTKELVQPDANYKKIDEIPFDFLRRRMSVVVEERGQRDILICKGALEEIFEVCSRVEDGDEICDIDDDLKDTLRQVSKELNEDGLRVIAVAYKETSTEHPAYSVKDESEMVLLGYLAFLDPPKESAALAIQKLEKHGVKVKVLTGDNDLVSKKICGQVGIDASRILLGPKIETMSDLELAEEAEQVAVFAKLTPAQKERIVNALHLKNHVVGFMGDGINDAPALKAADVGISVDNAVDIAKESADIILLENSLLVLEEGVQEGRRVFGNIVKYIKMGASSNFGNTFSVLGSSIILPFLPMQAVQILIQNLLYDFSQTAIPFDQVDEEYLAVPRRWEIGDIWRFMVFIGPISSIFDYSTFALMWYVYGANSIDKQNLFQSGWFVEGLLSQTLIVHMIRTNKIPFLQSRATWPLTLTTLAVMAIGIWVPFSPIGHYAKMSALPFSYFGWLFVTILCYAILTQIVKAWFVRRYGYR